MTHEHQNPNAGITWDEEAVYSYLGRPPNNWDRDTTFHNVLRTLDPREVERSTWDPDSIMDYQFPLGLINAPEAHKRGIFPGDLSEDDKVYARRWYPAQDDGGLQAIEPFKSVPSSLSPEGQPEFAIKPDASREYRVGTFGASDVVLVLFKDVDGDLKYLTGDDDSGEDRKALVSAKLYARRTYVARVRRYNAWASGHTALMHWSLTTFSASYPDALQSPTCVKSSAGSGDT